MYACTWIPEHPRDNEPVHQRNNTQEYCNHIHGNQNTKGYCTRIHGQQNTKGQRAPVYTNIRTPRDSVPLYTRVSEHKEIACPVYTDSRTPRDGMPMYNQLVSWLVGTLNPVNHKDYTQAEHKLHSISRPFISQVIIPQVLFLEPIYIPRALSIGTCLQQGDLFYSAGLHRNRSQPQPTQGKKSAELLEKMRVNGPERQK